ncbi:MAG: 50S ribosomal protein L23 [Lentimicrobium sp.]|nr:50S ribosomal protein L23 [Lentimicrobium sp.]
MGIIIKPVVTEKMTLLGDKLHRYGFIVQKSANKLQIKKAVEEIYGVEVTEVNTMNYAGKSKSRFTKAGLLTGRSNSYKKAIITIAEGETIDFYSNI